MAADWVKRGALAVASSLLLATGVAACGDDENPALSEERGRAFDRFRDARKRGIEKAVQRGDLPLVALEIIGPDGSINPNFVDGPNLNDDIVRTRDGGESGPKLQWDLDQNGRIDPDEREITEEDLYAATAGLR